MLDRVRKAVLDLQAYTAIGPRPGVRLDANESPYPPPEDFYSDLARELRLYGLNRYPDPTGLRVRTALAERLGGTPEQYLLGNGSDETLVLLPALFEHAPIAYFEPSFAMYRIGALTHRHEPLPIALRPDFEIDEVATLQVLRDKRPAVFFIASPNNPTNNAFDAALLTKLITSAPDTLFVIDEAYGPYNEWSAHRIFSAAPNVAVLGTLSKIGFAGLRLGWIRMDEPLAEQLNKLRAPYNASVPAQLGAALLLETYWQEAHRTIDQVIAERTRLEEELHQRGFGFTPSRSNSLLVDCHGQAKRVEQALEQGAVHVRWFSHDALREHFRVSVGSPDENSAFLKALPSL